MGLWLKMVKLWLLKMKIYLKDVMIQQKKRIIEKNKSSNRIQANGNLYLRTILEAVGK